MVSIMLVSLEQTKRRLRVDHEFENEDLVDLIKSCSAMVMGYLKVAVATVVDPIYWDSDAEYIIDSEGVVEGVFPEVQASVLYLAAFIYRDRDGVESKNWELGYLPFPVTSMIYHLRDPALS